MSEQLTTRQRLLLYVQNEGERRGKDAFTVTQMLDAFPDLTPLELVIHLDALARGGWLAWRDENRRTFALCEPIAMLYEDVVRVRLAAQQREAGA